MRANRPATGIRQHGFTVLELMLSVAIMMVIVIALYTVFDQTQKALRGSLAQVDTLEGLRATTDILARDLESASPIQMAGTNQSFAVRLSREWQPADLKGLANNPVPLVRTTVEDVFFVTRLNDTWTGIGYWVGSSNTNALDQPVTVGRLYRFSYQTNGAAFAYTNLYYRFLDPKLRLRSSQPVMDGVVHLRVLAYDGDGTPLVRDLATNTLAALRPWGAEAVPNPLSITFDSPRPDETRYAFHRLTVPPFPGALEVELAVLEPQSVIRFNAIPAGQEAMKFLTRNTGRVHLFRQRIRLRNGPAF